MNPISILFRTVFQVQIINKSLADLLHSAEEDGKMITENLADKPDTPENRTQLRHIIGIERWGQRRLKTMLDEPPIQDEYDGYQPAETLDMDALRDAYNITRAETLALAHTIQEKRHCRNSQGQSQRHGRCFTQDLAALSNHARQSRTQTDQMKCKNVMRKAISEKEYTSKYRAFYL